MKGSKNPEDKETRFAVEGEEEGHGECTEVVLSQGFWVNTQGKNIPETGSSMGKGIKMCLENCTWSMQPKRMGRRGEVEEADR